MKNEKYVRLGCFMSNITMATITNVPPLLFLTFREEFGISYSLLGMLVLINFFSQLIIDLIFSFFSHKFNIPKAVKATPFLYLSGLLAYAILPWLFPSHAYLGLVFGTVIFSASSGFCEVLISPVIAALPSDDPDRDMSKLHSVYAWGAVFIVIASTLFLLAFGKNSWHILCIILTVIPILAIYFFSKCTLPEMETPEKVSGVIEMLKNKGIWLCVLAIFLGGASEVTMAQWSSGYLEQVFRLPKVWGDILGVALFSVMLGFGRTLYAKRGKNIERVLFLSTLGATLCYFVAAISTTPIIGLVACAFTGFCVSMLWPGSLVVASGRYPSGGVFIYALMAAGGDFGASVGPQLVGVVTDFVITTPTLLTYAESLGVHPEQLGMKLGMLMGMLFPLCAISIFGIILKTRGNFPQKES